VPLTNEPVELLVGTGLAIVGQKVSSSENGWAAFLVRVLDPMGNLAVDAKIVDQPKE
jgi:hypothetical protein